MKSNIYLQARDLQAARDIEDGRMFKDADLTHSDEQDEVQGREWEEKAKAIIRNQAMATLGIMEAIERPLPERIFGKMRPIGSYRRSIGLE